MKLSQQSESPEFDLLPMQFRLDQQLQTTRYIWLSVIGVLVALIVSTSVAEMIHHRFETKRRDHLIAKVFPVVVLRQQIHNKRDHQASQILMIEAVESAKPKHTLLQTMAAIAAKSPTENQSIEIDSLRLQLPLEYEVQSGSGKATVEPQWASGSLHISANAKSSTAARQWVKQVKGIDRIDNNHFEETVPFQNPRATDSESNDLLDPRQPVAITASPFDGEPVTVNKTILRKPLHECLLLLDTRWKCHLLGGVVSLVLLLGTIAVRSFSVDSTVPLIISGEQVEEEDAYSLCALAAHYRSEYLNVEATNEVLQDRKRLIAEWLRNDIDPLSEQERISESAQQHQVELVSLKPGEIYTGSRIAVWSVKCEVRGSYIDMCRWIHAMTLSERPIMCRAIDLRRIRHDDSAGTAEGPACSASVELRIPFRGEGTVAAQIAPPEILPVSDGPMT